MLRPSLLRSCRRATRSIIRRGDSIVPPSLTRNPVTITPSTVRRLSGFTAFTTTDPETITRTPQPGVSQESHLAARIAALTRAFQVRFIVIYFNGRRYLVIILQILIPYKLEMQIFHLPFIRN
jgi:hypothetical protein